MVRKHKFILILISCLFFTSKDVRSYDVNLLRLIAKSISTFGAISLSHEFGHAITAKILFNSPIDIHFGDASKKSFLKFGPFTINSFNSNLGFNTVANLNSSKKDLITKIKRLLVYSSGPLIGILTGIIINKSIKKNNLENNILSIACKYFILDQLLQGFTPISIGQSTDGDKICNEVGLDKENHNKLKKLGYVTFIIFISSLFKEIISLK